MKSPILVALLTTCLLASCASTGSDSNSSATSAGGVKPYPLDICIVTDNELGSMGDPISLIHEGQEVKFCCRPCVKKFQRDPQRYLAQLQ